jgi:exodeoxyribonuclease-5
VDDIQLDSQQQEAFEDIQRWYESPTQWYYLGGWAGTGKTTMARRLAQQLAGDSVVYSAYTGKAALRLRELGCPGASTMHSFMYHSRESSKTQLKEYNEELAELLVELKAENLPQDYVDEHPGVQRLQGLIFQEEQNARRPIFKLNPESILKDMDLSVLDEVSMVNHEMKDDWLSYGQKTLVLGDPFQLPPVMGEGGFTRQAPNFMLTKIHRQAEGNPIIQLSTTIRGMQMPKCGWHGKTRIVRKSDLTPSELRDVVLASDQIIVGKNETRHQYNNRVRMLRGFKERFPMAGEKIVCLRNNHEKGLLNGALYEVVKCLEVFEDIDRLDMLIRPLGGGQEIEVHSHTHHFLGKEDVLAKLWFEKKDAEEFDYGYALTCHKTQGSQYKNPVIFDQSWIARDKRWNWLYTAITRAEESFTLVLQG